MTTTANLVERPPLRKFGTQTDNRVEPLSRRETQCIMTSDSDANSTVSRFVVTLVINTVIGLIVWFIWMILRTFLPKFYHPRDGEEGVPRYSRIPFRWLWDCLKIGDEQLMQTHGLDAVFYLRTIRLNLVLCLIMSVTMVVLLPVNGVVGNNNERADGDSLKTRGLDIITMSNIDKGDAAFAAHIIFVWWISVACYLGIWWTYRQYVVDREKYWFGKKDARCHTVLVRNMESGMDEEKLKGWFERIFHCEVLAINPVRVCPGLKKKRKNYDSFTAKLEKAEFKLERLKEGAERPTTRKGLLGLVGEKVDAENWFTEQKQLWADKVRSRHADPDHYKRTNAALVTLNETFPARSEFHPALITSSNRHMIVIPAPEPVDLLWDSLKIGRISRLIRTIAVYAFLVALIFFWAIPVTFISSISNLGTISQIEGFSWVSSIADVPTIIRGFIEGFLPSLALIIFMALLIPIIRLSTWLMGLYAYSQWERKVFTIYFYFQLVNVLLVSTFSGGVFTIVQRIVDDPTSAPELLAQTLPQQSLYFITYIIIAGFMNEALGMLRIVPLIIWAIKRLLAKTDREIAAANASPTGALGTSLAIRTLVFGMILIYNVMAPLIIPFGLIYFTIAYINDRYSLIFVEKRPWNGGGILWQSVFHTYMVLMLLFQITMIGLLAINKFVPVIAIIPLPFMTVIFWFCMYIQYRHLGQWGSLEDGWDGESIDYEEFKTKYVQPPFMPIGEEKEKDGNQELEMHEL